MVLKRVAESELRIYTCIAFGEHNARNWSGLSAPPSRT